MNLVTQLFRAIAEACGLLRHRSETRNAADVKRAKQAQQDVADQSKFEKAVANEDVEATRRGLSE